MLHVGASQGSMHIRHFNWMESLRHLNAESDCKRGSAEDALDGTQHAVDESGRLATEPASTNSTPDAAEPNSAAHIADLAPSLPVDEQFEVELIPSAA